MRHGGVTLLCIQILIAKRLGLVLQVMQGGVLASSPALAVAAVNQQAVTCLCGHKTPGM